MATTRTDRTIRTDEPDDDRGAPEPLWRELLGRRLRWLRLQRGETLGETARRAGVSPQYLSEVERGIKEPSSEMVAAIAGALDASLLDLTSAIAWELTAAATPPARRPAPVHRLAPTRTALATTQAPVHPLAPARTALALAA